MSVGTLYVHLNEGDGPFTRTVLAEHLVKYYKLDIKVPTGPDAHFPATYPAPKVPGFRFSDGTQLTESVPIALMIVDQIPKSGGLLGKETPAEFSEVLMWMNRFNFDFMVPLTVPFKMAAGRLPFDKAGYDEGTAAYRAELDIYERHLTKNTYLVGESVTLADLYAVQFFLRPMVYLFDAKVRAEYPAVMRWFETVKVHPVFDGFYDSLKYLDELKLPAH